MLILIIWRKINKIYLRTFAILNDWYTPFGTSKHKHIHEDAGANDHHKSTHMSIIKYA